MKKHFCVSVYIYDDVTQKFLLVKHKKMQKWVQPGGHVEENEDPEEAAIRECFEETGLKVELEGKRIPRQQDYILPLAIQNNEVNSEHYHMDFVYKARLKEKNNPIQNIEETDGIGWFSLEEIKKLETFKDVIEWCEYIKRGE